MTWFKGDLEKQKLWYREYRKKNAERLREYNRLYNKNWRRKNGYHNEKRSKIKNAEKTKTRHRTMRAVMNGKIKKLPCVVCGSEKSQAHHDDYSDHLKVKWLCALHHRQYEDKKYGRRYK